MSILLDALKKSERRQRLGEAPSLATDAGEPGGPQGDRTGSAWRYAVVVVPVLACIGWLAWQQYAPLGESVGQERRVAAAEAAGVADDVAGENTSSPNTADIDGREVTANEARVVTRRSPVEDLPDSPSLARAPDSDEGESPSADATASAEEMTPLREPSPVTESAEVQRTESRPDETRARESFDDANHGDGADGQARAQVLTYWELPGSVRNGLPPLAVTVMVYSDEPANRFALVDGRRLGEGDDAGSGVMLVRIRRDGVVFRKGAYRFLVKP
ncbi:hypothetical protein F3N42_06620 [Marinihelvus fidelis]|uniref:Type II secretion system protein GspB C-terminal domain-containing protein n=1 Tax=Marinihelvus fidelis TaxID=2613842 RepID=A0A5N0TCP8_9GAMM|nr:general secretion pathway protein GspB [Marinihelvus fidelis]KAA9131847.1 hypothetical protein F3N42_06620 [Marinihelvus fidelis]